MIIRTRDRGEMELRSFALTDMVKYGYDGLRNVSPVLGEKDIRGLPALHRAAKMKAEAVAQLQLRCWTGKGVDRTPADNNWQSRLFGGEANEYQTRFSFWETVGESLAWRNNAYIWKNVDPLSGQIIDWYALHPDQVKCIPPDQYEVRVLASSVDPVGRGPALYRVGDETLLHIRGHGQGGLLEAPTPIQVFREALAAPVERQRHENRMWRRGTSLQVAVVFPQGVSKEQADEWKPSWSSAYEGTSGDTTAIIGGGATIQPIGMTAADAQFVEMANLSVRDASMIMGVPANLLGAQTNLHGTVNLEQETTTWFRFGLSADLSRIETAISEDDQLFPNLGRSIYAMFDADTFVRADVATEAAVLVSLVQAGILLPDEARRIRGLDDLPGGVGKIPQVTPVGGAPNAAPATTNDVEPALNGAGGY